MPTPLETLVSPSMPEHQQFHQAEDQGMRTIRTGSSMQYSASSIDQIECEDQTFPSMNQYQPYSQTPSILIDGLTSHQLSSPTKHTFKRMVQPSYLSTSRPALHCNSAFITSALLAPPSTTAISHEPTGSSIQQCVD